MNKRSATKSPTTNLPLQESTTAVSEAVPTPSSLRKTHGNSASSDNQRTSSSTHSEKEISILVFIIKDLTNADDVEDISLIDNSTTAAAIVLQQIGRRFSSGAVMEVQLLFPVHSDHEIIVGFKKGLKRGEVDGRRVREEEVDQIFVDGAHAIGSLRVDIKEIGR